MDFTRPASLTVGNNLELGDRLLAVTEPPMRSHLVTPAATPANVYTQVQALQLQILALEARVVRLEAPGWWARHWMALRVWSRGAVRRVWWR